MEDRGFLEGGWIFIVKAMEEPLKELMMKNDII